MSDAQDKSIKEDPMTETETQVVMDEVAEERPAAAKKSCCTGFLAFLVLLCLVAGAGWYYQSFWWPQTQQGMQQAKAWFDNQIAAREERDLMAAPTPKAQEEETSSVSDYVVSAITDPETVVETQPAAEEKAELKPVAEPVQQTVEVSKSEAEEQVAVVAEAKPEPTVAEAESQATVVEAEPEPVVAETESVAAAQPAPVTTVETAENSVSPMPELTGAMVADAAPMTDAPIFKPVPETGSSKAVIDLAGARKAFWERDLPKAEALYKVEIARVKTDADSWGELGNIYYFQAKWQQAASAYTEAAIILLNKGDISQAMFLRYIVFGLDPAQAKRIDERLQAMQAPLKG